MAGIMESMYGNQGGGGGGDSHNKGHYATPEDLRTAYPTAEPGDYATVESTDTMWLWDNDTTDWKDSHKTDAVTSVNGQTGDVVLSASDVGALPSDTHIPTDPVQADWNESDSTALGYIKNKPTLGTAAAAASTDFATAAQGAKADTAIQSVKTINGETIVGEGNVDIDGLPSQTGNAGKVLKTNGTVAGWEDTSTSPTTLPLLVVANWVLNQQNNKYEQTVNCAGVTASNTVFVSPSPVNTEEWGQCGVYCYDQGAGTLSFRCDTVPQNALSVNVIIV